MNSSKYPVQLKSFEAIYRAHKKSGIRFWFIGLIVFAVLVLFLPWTQNIMAKGYVTTLYQEQRPQEINSPIPGKIIKWWVKEGDMVKKGDTLLQLSEIKEDYLDPQLVSRTQQQVDAKKGSLNYYREKVFTAARQIEALEKAKEYKIEQLINKAIQLNSKLTAEKAELEAVINEYNLAKDQYERQQKMYEEGLVSQTQLQQRNALYQNALSKKTIVENKILQTKQEINNLAIEQNSIEQEYNEKTSKAEGDRFQSLSQIATGQADVAKLENQVSNYIIRNGMYIILAPQDGQIYKAKSAGIGEIIKEGEHITGIVPIQNDYAVEMFIRPVDLPLINVGQKVRFTFDGYPAIIFSGWPEGSYGTFGGEVVAYENTIGSNGLFRVLIKEDASVKKWPEQLKIGTGAKCIALLKDVKVWYELWRNVNGFPPDYYQMKESKSVESKDKSSSK